ncbi:MAG: hypothetical protein ACM3RX_05725 [Methanococcaceae archaeon]
MSRCRKFDLDTSHWESPNSRATNESGFTALPESRRLALPFSLPFFFVVPSGLPSSPSVTSGKLDLTVQNINDG